MRRPSGQIGFADLLVGAGRSRSDKFFSRVDQAVDWRPFEDAMKDLRSSPLGQPGFTPLMLFKVLLIQAWYNLSDPAAEDALNDRKSFARFVGLRLDEKAPDHSVIWRFRQELADKGLLPVLMDELARQIDAAGLILRQGTIMDATFVPSAARPPYAQPKAAKAKPDKKGKEGKEKEEGKEEKAEDAGPPPAEEAGKTEPPEASQADKPAKADPARKRAKPDALYIEGKRSAVDPDARWAVKGRKAYFGYKLHISADAGRRIIRRVKLTAANVNDSEIGPDLVCPDGDAHYADKAYGCERLSQKLQEHGLADGIMQRGNKHHPLTAAERRRNKYLAPIRAAVEGVFGECKTRLGLSRAKYFGLARVQAQCDIAVLAFNLKTMALA